MQIAIVCVESCLYSNHVTRNIEPAIYVVKRNANGKDITFLKLRSRLNAELTYFTVLFGDDLENITDEQLVDYCKTVDFQSDSIRRI